MCPLQDAYSILIKGFGKTGAAAAPGPGATVAGLKPASFAQKLWRFCIDPRLEESALIEPMHTMVRQEVARLFGTADAPEGVLRIARGRSCSGGDVPGRPCQTDAECPNGVCGPGAFDFATCSMRASSIVAARGATGTTSMPREFE